MVGLRFDSRDGKEVNVMCSRIFGKIGEKFPSQ